MVRFALFDHSGCCVKNEPERVNMEDKLRERKRKNVREAGNVCQHQTLGWLEGSRVEIKSNLFMSIKLPNSIWPGSATYTKGNFLSCFFIFKVGIVCV